MKRFNYTGSCIPQKHYMVDTSSKINQIKKYVDFGEYFTINRPRQYGKTTTLFLLEERLKTEYVLISISFEGTGESMFETEEMFCKSFLSQISDNLLNDDELKQFIKSQDYKSKTLLELSKVISDIVKNSGKKIVLLVDEVDKASNHILFLNFLGMIRSKYLVSQKGRDMTFYSVILAGVHDIKNIKMKMTDEIITQFNSPWAGHFVNTPLLANAPLNIAIDFKVEMSFSTEEIRTMLSQYEKDRSVKINKEIAKSLHNYTNGYPYLVSKLCYLIDEELNRNFTKEGLEAAVKILLNENNTLFDDLIKNIENNKELSMLVENLLIRGDSIDYVQTNPVISIGAMFGILSKTEDRKIKIHNKIFEILLYNHMVSKLNEESTNLSRYNFRDNFIDKNGDIELEKILIKFQQFIKENYSDKDQEFYERQGRLLLIAFIKPIINGVGFYYIENQVSYEKRLDMVITYNEKEYIIEFKVWYGKEYHEAGLGQLENYLEIRNHKKGYLIVFNFNKKKEYSAKWLKRNNKDIFEVIV